jgi:hypothetical protein
MDVFSSDGLLIIDDDNVDTYCPSEGMTIDGEFKSTGWRKNQDESLPGVCEAFPFQIYPENEWADRIQEYDNDKRSPFHLLDRYGMPPLDQNGTNYCWENCVACIAMIELLSQGFGYRSLSPASVAAMIKGGANQGGFPTEGLEYMARHGIAETQFWPANDRNIRKYDTPESRANRIKYVPTKWYKIPDKNYGAIVTALLMGFKLAIAYPWWSHAVAVLAPALNGTKNLNSWGPNYPKQGGLGRFIVERRKASDYFDCFALAEMKPLAI